MAKGSKTTSTRDPTRAASTSKVLPCKETVAVLVTVRTSDHKNASCSAAGLGSAGGAAGEQPLDGAWPGLGMGPAVIDGLDPGAEQPVELGQVRRGPGLDLDQELGPHRLEEALSIFPRP